MRVLILASIALFVLACATTRDATTEPVEEWVTPNLVRVYINGAWEEFPLVPLTSQRCSGDTSLPDACPDIPVR